MTKSDKIKSLTMRKGNYTQRNMSIDDDQWDRLCVMANHFGISKTKMMELIIQFEFNEFVEENPEYAELN